MQFQYSFYFQCKLVTRIDTGKWNNINQSIQNMGYCQEWYKISQNTHLREHKLVQIILKYAHTHAHF